MKTKNNKKAEKRSFFKITKRDITRLKKIRLTKSQTFPQVIFWITIMLGMFFLENRYRIGENLDYIVRISGIASFAYLGISYTAEFFSNRSLPKGLGELRDLNQYKIISWTWIIILCVSIFGKYVLKIDVIPLTDIIFITGTISITFIGGNKSNRIATEING